MNQRETLRQAADKKNFVIGAAVSPKWLEADPKYTQLLEEQFNAVVPENALKFGHIHRESEAYIFEPADRIVQFAKQHQQKVRGHTLVWNNVQPSTWLNEGNHSKSQLRQILTRHFETVLDRYRGSVYAWDVVNEAYWKDGKLDKSIWLDAFGDDYIAELFNLAHQIDPDIQLFYNDWGLEELCPKSDAVYKLSRNLLERGVPLHGIGLQMHIGPGAPGVEHVPDFESLAANLQRFSDLGLDIHITEMDVSMQKFPGTTEEKAAEQAGLYGEITRIALATPRCTALFVWGVSDKYSWIPGYTGHDDAPLLFDEQMQPKPAFDGVLRSLQAMKSR